MSNSVVAPNLKSTRSCSSDSASSTLLYKIDVSSVPSAGILPMPSLMKILWCHAVNLRVSSKTMRKYHSKY